MMDLPEFSAVGGFECGKLQSIMTMPKTRADSNDNIQKFSSEIQILFNLHNFLFKLFMNIEFKNSDFNLNQLEQKIVRTIFEKKEFLGHRDICFDTDFFNVARKTNMRKKTEDGLKFVFKKAIKYMKKEFKTRILTAAESKKIKTEQLDRCFYEHYFGAISKKFNMPLESFFHFRNWKKRDSIHIPKSITKQYMSRLKLNSVFIRKINYFLTEELIKKFLVFNSKKIRTMIIKWEKIIEENGSDIGLQKIVKMINSRGNKIPWTIFEVQNALQNTLDYLEKS